MNGCIRLALASAAFAAAASAEQVRVKGSNTFGEEFGPLAIAAFETTHPDIDVTLESQNTGWGIQTLLDGTADIAAASRTANEDELRLARSRGVKLQHHGIGYYGVAVIVHASNPVLSLTDSEVKDLFTGRITSWKAVGGRDTPVTLCIRDPVSGTYLGFQELAMSKLPYAEGAKTHLRYADIAAAVAADPNAIGYVDLRSAASAAGIKTLAINQFPPSQVSIAENLYPYVRLLRFYTRRGDTSPAAMRFVRWMQSKDGQAVVESFGYSPLRQIAPTSLIPQQ